MDRSASKNRNCCGVERQRLVKELHKCDYCSESYQEYQQCYSAAAVESGERARSCISS